MIECPTKPTQQRFKWVLRSLPSANTIKTEVLSPKNDFSPLCMSSGVEREREREREKCRDGEKATDSQRERGKSR